MKQSAEVNNNLASSEPSEGFGLDKFASVFRWLGTLAVVLSAAAYMLEGFDVASSELRHWVCLGMMSTVAGAGLFSQLIMKDSKTARLLFAIAIGLISVQFSHLGGIIFDNYGDTIRSTSFMARGTALGFQQIATITALSLFASLPVAYIGFQILARQHAATLTLSYIAINTLLLLPERVSLLGISVTAATVLTTVGLFVLMFTRHTLYHTREGIAVQLLFLSAPAIALIRLAFYFGDIAGYCSMGLVAAALLVKSASAWIRRRPLQEAAFLCATLLAIPCWHELATVVFSLPLSELHLAVRFAPVVGFLLLVSQYSPGMGRLYRMLSMMVLALLTYILCLEQYSYISTIAALLSNLLVLVWGVGKRYREPTLCGFVMSVLSLLVLSMQLLANINSEVWVVLSLIGFCLVMLATVIERYGKNLASTIPRSWDTLSRWP